MKRYTITTFTKANRTEYFHAVTVEADNVKSAKEAAAEHIRATLDRHAFRMSNATAPASVEYIQWIADRFNVTVEDVMKAAAEPEGVDIYADEFKPAPVEAENPINSGNAPLYVWTFANGAESAATLTAEASSAADATEYARAARICANEAAEAAEIADTAEAAKDAERARIAADNAEAIRAYWDAHEEAKAAESAETATSAAALDYDHITAAEHAEEAEKHADAAEKAAQKAANLADEANDPEVSSIAEMAAEEAERARQFAADARETAEKNAAEVAELKDVDTYASTANTCANSAEWAERKAEDATTAKSAAARAHQARVFATFASEAADKARASLNYSIRAYFADYETSAYSAEAVRIRREHAAAAQTAADRAEQAAQRAEAIAEQMSAVEAEQAAAAAKADAAADALTREYRSIVNDHPTTTPDPCTREAEAARRVARHDIAHELGSTREDRETVSYMVEAIAERTHAAEAIEDAREAWTGPDYYRIAYSDGGMDATNDGTIWYETAADLARDLRSAYESATDTHLPYAERIERPAYQRAELEAFLGDFLEEYDADAIEAEATEYDPATGRTVWTPEAVRDLWTICERHELYSYAPAI